MEAVSIHHQNIQKLGIEMSKNLNVENPQIVNETFRISYEASYDFRQKSCFRISSASIVFSGTESTQFFGSKVWELIANKIKCLENQINFKAEI